MVMKLSVPRPNRRLISRATARNAALVNQFAMPGLGSLMAGRWIAGIGQLILAISGFAFVAVWFFEVMVQTYQQIDGETAPHDVGWIGKTGAILFMASWFWALITSISLIMRTKSEEPPVPETPQSPPKNRTTEPPKLSK